MFLKIRCRTLAFITPVLFSLLLFISCEKAEQNIPTADTAKLELYLTDAPGSYRSVYLDIKKVSVRIDYASSQNTDAGQWQNLPMEQPSLFDLLSLRNGKDTLLAAGQVKAGTLREIRLKLGKKSKVILHDGSTAILRCPDSIHSDAMLVLGAGNRTTGNQEVHHLVLDFDLSRSIIPTASSKDSTQTAYMFIPATRTFSKEAGGAIQGWVFPEAARAKVMALDAEKDTFTTRPDANGYYKLWGIPAGTYTLQYQPDSSSGYQSETKTGIQLINGQLITGDSITLHR